MTSQLAPIVGLHHVTAIASDPQRNLDFYTEVLGLRFVKRTVNFDDPGTYHFYFGDDAGSPGTIITFFPWPHARRGRAGAGEVTHTAYSVPAGSLDYWEKRLADNGVLAERNGKRFNEDVLTLADPDGMKIELVAHALPLRGGQHTRQPDRYCCRTTGELRFIRSGVGAPYCLPCAGRRGAGSVARRDRETPVCNASAGP
jgi:catechol 2,3-dioxygenase-like lactoylglutathione lyase family enzyme